MDIGERQWGGRNIYRSDRTYLGVEVVQLRML
jgi:hypothetical protein